MTKFTIEIMQTLLNKGDLDELFQDHLERAINSLLQAELTAFLDYEKYDRNGFNSGNSRNGNYSRTFKTEYGELNLTIPRDRNGEFSQQTLPAYKRTNDSLETTIIQLFQKGITMAEISKLIEKMYDHHYTPQTISNMSKLVAEDVLAFKERNVRSQLFRYIYGCDAYPCEATDCFEGSSVYYDWYSFGWNQRSSWVYYCPN